MLLRYSLWIKQIKNLLKFFDTNNYKPTKTKLGEGSFGKVYVVKNVNDGIKYAAKILTTNGMFNGHDQMTFLRESLILYKLDHPAIVKFHGIYFHSFDDPKLLEPTILTEYLSNGSLKEILDKEKTA